MPSIVAGSSRAARVTEESSSVLLDWQQFDNLPDPVGLKGMYAGAHNGAIVLAGGTNFPVAQRAGGRKAFHSAIYVRSLPLKRDHGWTTAAATLPRGLGEGAAVTTPDGIVCVGGHDEKSPVTDAFLLTWHAGTRSIERRPLPALPISAANAAAAWHRGSVYLAGGESQQGTRRTLWRLDLAAAITTPAAAKWEALPSWPGRPRFGSILCPVTTPAGERLLLAGGMHGPAKSSTDYLRDAFLFDPHTAAWQPAADMPRGAVLAAAVQADVSTVMVLGGSHGHDFERMRQMGERYRIPNNILQYDAGRDRWSRSGAMPLGVVGAAVVDLGGKWLLAGGEFSPGLRTARVFTFTIQMSGGGHDR